MKFYFILMILALDIIEAALASNAICNLSFNTEQHLRTVNIITGALYVSMAATSITATFIISRCIYLQTTRVSSKHSRKRYKSIVDILIQSSALYTSSLIVGTVANFLNSGSTLASITPIILGNYSDALVLVFTVG